MEVVEREAKISVDAFEAEDATRDGGRNKDGAAECGRELVAARDNVRFFFLSSTRSHSVLFIFWIR